MKKLTLFTWFLLLGTFLQGYAQSGDLEVVSIDPAKSPLSVGETSELILAVNQNGPQDLPTGSARVTISMDTRYTNWVTPLTITDECGGIWTLQTTNVTGTTAQIQIRNNGGPLTFLAECIIHIPIQAVAVGKGSITVGSTVFGPGVSDPNGTNQGANSAVNVIGPTPVTLGSFVASKEGLSAQLGWVTLQEKNTKSFEVEHSLDGRSWRQLGSVAAVGNSLTQQRYSYQDTDPANGLNYYRLRMVDLDGHTELSRSQSLSFERGLQASVYPNPAVDYLTLEVKDISKVASVQILSTTGRAVYESAAPATQVKVSSLTKGLYLVRFQFKNGSTETYKVIKQ
ncbi:T9SS type A sorting domain-containing protein [Siphonobacter curvatus]|uniref:Secretion system C-terminal sorting domain-containing protein n=1 Tax=Siphonobacter curvatus TaxID=2094562 RepID=A0A2S7II64_9BACT|nr:T9SS type A sorting domain-containing protein [Siphonobacter curvatus]PQA56090.1 hypothetical protein C5O19_17170 [Siphonobacter curvatus]